MQESSKCMDENNGLVASWGCAFKDGENYHQKAAAKSFLKRILLQCSTMWEMPGMSEAFKGSRRGSAGPFIITQSGKCNNHTKYGVDGWVGLMCGLIFCLLFDFSSVFWQ